MVKRRGSGLRKVTTESRMQVKASSLPEMFTSCLMNSLPCFTLSFTSTLHRARTTRSQINKIPNHASPNPRNQGLPPDGTQKGCQICQDQEEQGEREVQGAMQPLPVHPGHPGPRKGREAQTVFATRSCCQGAEMNCMINKMGSECSSIVCLHFV